MLLHVRPGHTLAVPCPLARTSLMHWSWALYSQGLASSSSGWLASTGSQPMACSLKLQRRPDPQVCSCLPWQYWVCARSGRRGTGVVSGSRGDDKLVTSSQQPMH